MRRLYSYARLSCLVLAVLLCACRDGTEGLREWQPSDHQPPPAVPEGQGAAQEGEDGTARAVQALWQMRCARCHGERGGGDGPERPPGAAIPDMREPRWQASRTDAALREVIVEGRGMMPAFGDALTEAGISVLVAHIRSLAPEQAQP